MNKRQMELANKMAEELTSVVDDCKQACGNETVMPELQDLLWQWELARSELMVWLFKMSDKGYSVSIGEPHYCEPDEVFLMSAHNNDPRLLASAAHKWHDQMDLVDFYFFQEGQSKADGWLVWVPSNDVGEQLGDHTIGGDLEIVIEEAA